MRPWPTAPGTHGKLVTVSETPRPQFPRRRALLALAASLSLALVGCGSEAGLPDDDTRTEQAVGLEVDPVRVTVQDAGAEPRANLEFRDVDNPAQETTATVARGFAQSVAPAEKADPAAPAAPESLDAPGLKATSLPLTAATTEAAAEDNGTRRVQFRLGETDDLPGAAGFEAGWTAEASGKVSTVRLAPPVDADDDIRAAAEDAVMGIASLPVVFPADPVGPGASWTVDSRVTGQSTLLQTTTYTLDNVDGDRVELSVAVQQRPAVGALDMSGVPDAPDGELRVLHSTTSSRGSLSVDLTRPLPVAGTVAATTRVTYGGDGDNRVMQDTTTALSLG